MSAFTSEARCLPGAPRRRTPATSPRGAGKEGEIDFEASVSTYRHTYCAASCPPGDGDVEIVFQVMCGRCLFWHFTVSAQRSLSATFPIPCRILPPSGASTPAQPSSLACPAQPDVCSSCGWVRISVCVMRSQIVLTVVTQSSGLHA